MGLPKGCRLDVDVSRKSDDQKSTLTKHYSKRVVKEAQKEARELREKFKGHGV